MQYKPLLLALTLGLGFTAPILPVHAAPPAAAVPSVSYTPADVMRLTEKVADYQIASLAAGLVPAHASGDTPDPKNWVQGALFIGLTALADHSDNGLYKQVVLQRGEANHWELGKRLYHADDHAIGQVYLWAARHGAGPDAIAPLRKSYDTILEFQPTVGLEHREYTDPRGVDCGQRWCWADALFMAPATWLELANQTGEAKYRDYAVKEFWAATDYLYDKTEHLYYRDSRFFERRGPHGEKVFWSRGDGWVFAGLAHIIPLMPQGADRSRMETIFKEMAAKLVSIQKADGYWSPSLLADPATSVPESSGTAFYVYGLAWGVKAGLLDAKAYEPAVRKGWAALVRSVHPDGKLGYVQAIGDQPDNVSYDDTQYYGVGAFLMAGTAVADLQLGSRKK
ncbi:glycoside hydrolase family 105 protein [Asticcacaulis sp. 201]|uniref:glycoside hydrolase family 88/105 protein n=1 Tax=Asticcacaulis sp. 201 TaxID=3028787 RepID=UPI002916F73F|nr:glycoside hydrolase family 88 protein [Asticcacaulis sp. 201]MDV6332300.1 glycoside hydrolase family 88 protein [Asticcacaulis sp. 201]